MLLLSSQYCTILKLGRLFLNQAASILKNTLNSCLYFYDFDYINVYNKFNFSYALYNQLE